MYPVPLQGTELRPGSLMIIPNPMGCMREGQNRLFHIVPVGGMAHCQHNQDLWDGRQCCGSYPRERCKDELEETAPWLARDKASVENRMRNKNGGRGSRDQEEKGQGES